MCVCARVVCVCVCARVVCVCVCVCVCTCGVCAYVCEYADACVCLYVALSALTMRKLLPPRHGRTVSYVCVHFISSILRLIKKVPRGV